LIQRAAHRARRQDPPALTGFDDLREAGRRAGRIEGDVEAIRLVDAEEADDRRRRLGHQEADPVPSLAPGVSQESRELIRLLLQPRVGQPLAVADHRQSRLSLRLNGYPLLE